MKTLSSSESITAARAVQLHQKSSSVKTKKDRTLASCRESIALSGWPRIKGGQVGGIAGFAHFAQGHLYFVFNLAIPVANQLSEMRSCLVSCPSARSNLIAVTAR